MYHRERETKPAVAAAYNKSQKQAAAERLKAFAAYNKKKKAKTLEV